MFFSLALLTSGTSISWTDADRSRLVLPALVGVEIRGRGVESLDTLLGPEGSSTWFVCPVGVGGSG